MEGYQRLRLQCPEYITLLWSLTETPGDVTTYQDRKETQSSRQLLPVEERQLADAFAFIASWKDDPDDVVAVCVEERHFPDTATTIRVASNTGNPSEVVDKLQCVASVMMHARNRAISRLKLQEEMFGQVVEMCMDRILSRLRSRHARRTKRTIGKPCIPSQMLEAVNRCALVASTKMHGITRQVVREAEAIARAFELVEASSKGQPRVMRLMDVLRSTSHCDLAALSRTLSIDRSLDPTLKSHLPKAISKLARYFELSKYLINAARTERHSLFHNIKIVAIKHPAFDPQYLIGPLRPVDHLLQEHGWQKHQNDPSARRSETKYRARMSDPRAIWKVHAEIQILIFYETTPQSFKPRIISASKLACFCCDLFFRSHGSFRIPGTHGKIYNTWMLPELPDDVSVRIRPALQRFLSELRHTFIPSAMGPKKSCPPPAESAVFDLQPCSSTSTLQQESISSIPERDRVGTCRPLLAMQSAISPPPSARPEQTALPEGSDSTVNTTATSVITVEKECSEASKSTILSANSITFTNGLSNINSSFEALSENKVIEKRVDSSMTTMIAVDSLLLFLSVQLLSGEAMSEWNTDYTSSFSVRLEEVGKGQCEEEALEQRYFVIDLGALAPGQDYTIPVGAATSRNKIILRNNDQQLLLSLNAPETLSLP